MELTRERWEGLRAAERTAAARKLAKELPTGFEFQGVATHRCGSVQRRVASFVQDNREFVLVPADEATLGWSLDGGWSATPAEREDWTESVEDFGYPPKLERFLAKVCSPVRRVAIPPLLVECRADELGWEPIPFDDPAVVPLHKDFRKTSELTQFREAGAIRLRRNSRGKPVAHRALPATHARYAKEWSRAGFRLPTTDEWEYLCGAGARTLFRWGDHAPLDRDPLVVPRKTRGGAAAKRPNAGNFDAQWAGHRLPNALGLSIAFDSYRQEVVAEPGRLCGGDGGCTICGGEGGFLSWLPLATAFFQKETCKYPRGASISAGFVGRRVFPLA